MRRLTICFLLLVCALFLPSCYSPALASTQTQTLDELEVILNRQEQRYNLLESQYQVLIANSDEQAKASVEALKQLSETKASLTKTKKDLESANSSLTQAERTIKELNNSLNQCEKQIKELEHKRNLAVRQRNSWAVGGILTALLLII